MSKLNQVAWRGGQFVPGCPGRFRKKNQSLSPCFTVFFGLSRKSWGITLVTDVDVTIHSCIFSSVGQKQLRHAKGKTMNNTFWLILRDRGGFAMETLNFSSEGDRETRIHHFLQENPAELGYSYESFEE